MRSSSVTIGANAPASMQLLPPLAVVGPGDVPNGRRWVRVQTALFVLKTERGRDMHRVQVRASISRVKPTLCQASSHAFLFISGGLLEINDGDPYRALTYAQVD